MHTRRDQTRDLGLIVGNAKVTSRNPFLVRNEIGIWYYGTDGTPARVEWLTWAIIGWVPLWTEDWGL